MKFSTVDIGKHLSKIKSRLGRRNALRLHLARNAFAMGFERIGLLLMPPIQGGTSPYTCRNVVSLVATGGTPAGPTTVTGVIEVSFTDNTGDFEAASDDDAEYRTYPQPYKGSISIQGENPVSLEQLRGARQQTVVVRWNNLDTGNDIKTTITNASFKQAAVRGSYGEQAKWTLEGKGGSITNEDYGSS